MLNLNGLYPLEVEFYVETEYEGYQTLVFEISQDHQYYKEITEESSIEYDGQIYNVKSIDEQAITTVECTLNMDALKEVVYTEYTSTTLTLSEVLTDILNGTGWTAVNADLVTIKRSMELTDVTTLDIIDECRKVYGVVYEIDSKAKTLTVIKPENTQSKGQYFTDQLNLRRTDYKSDTYDFCTRLYPYGADGLTIESVNDGLTYIDNNAYSSKVISRVWRDNRYTDAQSLLDDAIEYLAILSQPQKCYQLDVIDIYALDGSYSHLELAMYDKVTLMDRNRKSAVEHQIVKMRRYPLHPENNQITLSTVAQKIEGYIKTELADINTELLVEKTKTNEIKRDLDATILRVAETYTIGETNTAIEGAVTIGADVLRLEVSENYATKTELELTADEINETIKRTGGINLIRNSGARYDTEDWIITGTVTAETDSDSVNYTSAGSYFKAINGSMSQSVKLAIAHGFTISFLYKNASLVHSKVSLLGDIEYSLLDTTAEVATWTKISQYIEPTASPHTLLIESDDDNFCITDIRIAEGTSDIWDGAPGEVYTAGQRSTSRGTTYLQSGSPIETTIGSTGVTVTNTDTDEEIASYDSDGVVTKDIKVSGQIKQEEARQIYDAANKAIFWIING